MRVAGCCRYLTPRGCAAYWGQIQFYSWAKARVHPEWVASSLQDPYWWQWLPHRGGFKPATFQSLDPQLYPLSYSCPYNHTFIMEITIASFVTIEWLLLSTGAGSASREYTMLHRHVPTVALKGQALALGGGLLKRRMKCEVFSWLLSEISPVEATKSYTSKFCKKNDVLYMRTKPCWTRLTWQYKERQRYSSEQQSHKNVRNHQSLVK